MLTAFTLQKSGSSHKEHSLARRGILVKLPRSGGLALPKDQAQTMMHLLALKRAEPDQLKALYQAMGLGRGIEG